MDQKFFALVSGSGLRGAFGKKSARFFCPFIKDLAKPLQKNSAAFRGKKIYRRIIALVVLVSFVFEQPVIAGGDPGVLAFEAGALTQGRLSAPFGSRPGAENLSWPEKSGALKKAYKGKNGKLLIHIQDADMNEDAQRNIARILDYFVRKSGVRLVHLEGASGRLSHRILSLYPDAKSRKFAGEMFLKNGTFSGAEYLAVTKRPELILHGIEDRGLYEKNREAFLEASGAAPRSRGYLARLRRAASGMIRFAFPPEIRELLRRQRDFHQEKISLQEYASFLRGLSETLQLKSADTQIKTLLKIADLEAGIRRDLVDSEMLEYAKSFSKALKGASKENFLKKQKAYEEKRISRNAYLHFVLGLKLSGPSPDNFPNLGKYSEALRLSEEIDERIFEEITAIEAGIKEKLIVSKEGKELESLLCLLDILEKIFDFSLTHEDAAFFFKNRERFRISKITTSFSGLLKFYSFESGSLKAAPDFFEGDLNKVELFYHYASLRDEVLVERALTEMNNLKEDVAVIVTGGFHSPKIEETLRSEGVSYYVITPRINHLRPEKEKRLYMEGMRGLPSGLSKRLADLARLREKPRMKDPLLQLQTPRRLPSEDFLKNNFGSESKGLAAMVRDFPEMDFMLQAMVALSVQGIRENGRPSPDNFDRLAARLRPEEKKLAGLVYPLLHSSESILVSGPESGWLLGPFSSSEQLGLAVEWKRNSRAGTPGQSGDYTFQTPDRDEVKVRWVRHPSQHNVEKKSMRRIQLSLEAAQIFRKKIPRIKKKQSALETRKTAELQNLKGPARMIEPVRARSELRNAKISGPLVDLPVLVMSLAAFGISFEGLLLASGLIVLLRTGIASSFFLHEWFHLGFAVLFQEIPFETARNAFFRDNPKENWLVSLVPFQPLVIGASVDLEAESGAIRNAGWIGSLIYAGFWVLGSYWLFQYEIGILFFAMLPGSLITLGLSLVYDLLKPQEAGVYCCGNQGVLKRRARRERNQIVPRLTESKLEKMGGVTKGRGEQAAGRVVFTKNGLLRFRLVNPKRGDLEKGLRRISRLGVFRGRLAGERASSGVSFVMEHYRYGTSSAPEEGETHPHQWMPERKVWVWRIISGSWIRVRVALSNVITHNGDFDDWHIFGGAVPNDKIGFWLEHVLHTPDDTFGDSPKIAGMMDLIVTQGMWNASARLAYQLAVADSIRDAFGGHDPPELPSGHGVTRAKIRRAKNKAVNTAPTKKQIQAWAKIFETVFNRHKSKIAAGGITRLEDVSEETIRELAEAARLELEQDPGIANWSVEKKKSFADETVKAFFKNNLYAATKLFMSRAGGSFGLITASTLEDDGFVVSVRGQPISLAFDPEQEEIAYASEAVALKIPLDKKGRMMPQRLDLDQVGGETVEVKLDGLRIYSEFLGREITAEELATSGRIIEQNDNPYITPFRALKTKDPVGGDLKAVPAVLSGIHEDWQNPDSFNRRSASAFMEFFKQKELEPAARTADGELDFLAVGVENSQWLSEQFANDFHSAFRKVKTASVSTNKILEFASQGLKIPGLGPNTVVLITSQSGQTFPSLNAAIYLEKILPGRVFVMTGEIDSLMGLAVGQAYYKGAPFSERIFVNGAGRRPAEAATVATAAAHQTMTELLLHLMNQLPQITSRPSALGLSVSPQEIAGLERMNQSVIDRGSVSITGYTARGEKVDSKENKELLAQGRQWGRHALEPAIVWGLASIYIFVTVVFGIPLFSTVYTSLLSSWLPAPEIFTYVFRAFDAVLYIFLGFFLSLGIRGLEGRKMFARTGKRTVVIGDVSYVHQILESFVSKLFSLSYGIASVDVHGANPKDHMLHRFGHRITRGTLVLLGRPDGRMDALKNAESNVLMTAKQAKGVQNYGIGAEVVTIGHNPSKNPNAMDRGIDLWSHQRTPASPTVQRFYESRFGSFERLLASYVLFYAMAKKVSSFRPLRFDMSRSQSGTKIATTAAPVSGAELSKLFQNQAGKPERLIKLTEKPVPLPFKIKTPAGRPTASGISPDATRKTQKPPVTDQKPGEGARSELRQAVPQLVRGLKEKTRIERNMRLEREIPLRRYQQRAAEQGFILADAVRSFSSFVPSGEFVSSENLLNRGEIIFNYRAQAHDWNFVREFIKDADRDGIAMLIFFKDSQTHLEDWENLRLKVFAMPQKPEVRIIFWNQESGALESLVKLRAQKRRLNPEDVVQFLDALSVKSHERKYYQGMMLGAVPLAQSTVLVLGSPRQIGGARVFNIFRLIDRLFAARSRIEQSA